MFKKNHALATVTAVIPTNQAEDVVRRVVEKEQLNIHLWKARGTLLHSNWVRRLFPPISPGKTVMETLVPVERVDDVMNTIVMESKLHLQAVGAIYARTYDFAHMGSKFKLPSSAKQSQESEYSHNQGKNLGIIYCIVTHQIADKISKAAINAGAHGPIVYFSEGRGLRDRLGWLRVTKEAEKEVLQVIADEDDVEEIFDAMAKAGELHLPGRGFMFRVEIEKGMFNLPSRVTHHHFEASMHQIINAIDHLSGHTHWRDQTAFDVGGQGRGTGVAFLKDLAPKIENQQCISTIVRRDQAQPLMDLMLDAGAPGVNIHYTRFTSPHDQVDEHGVQIMDEYAIMNAITSEEKAAFVCKTIEFFAEKEGIDDFCVFGSKVPQVATYVYQGKNQRKKKAA